MFALEAEAAEPEPQPAPMPTFRPLDPEPAIAKVFEPLRAAQVTNPTGVATEQAPEPEDEGRPVALAPQPKVLAAPPRPIKKIVDPAVADEYDEPLSIAPPHFVAEPRHGRAGSWLSLFGRPRTEVPRPTLRPTGGAQPALHPSEEASEESDDLEIPSFLRRLAN